MKVVVAIDSFKGSLTSLEAGEAIRQGIHRVIPDAEVLVRPLADGGEGTVEALTLGMGGTLHTIEVTGPLGQPVQATYGIAPLPQEKETSEHGQNLPPSGGDKRGAYIEMSAAAGITLVPTEQRNPLHTTTYGVGELIVDAIRKGCRHFIVGIGGSATNDGGIGMLQALGFDLLDQHGNQVPFGAKGLKELTTIRTEHVLPELHECTFRVACDVTNPLCGAQGCSAIFGPQKGATPEMITQMDTWLQHYAALAEKTFRNPDIPISRYSENNQTPPSGGWGAPGTGAAGGLGFAFLTFLPAVLESGIQIVLEETHLEDYIRNADLVITGEGRLDKQTIMGKAPSGVAKIAKKHNKRVIAFAGCVTPEAGVCNQHGIDAFFPILRSVVTLDEAMNTENAKKNMTDTVEQVFRLLCQ